MLSADKRGHIRTEIKAHSTSWTARSFSSPSGSGASQMSGGPGDSCAWCCWGSWDSCPGSVCQKKRTRVRVRWSLHMHHLSHNLTHWFRWQAIIEASHSCTASVRCFHGIYSCWEILNITQFPKWPAIFCAAKLCKILVLVWCSDEQCTLTARLLSAVRGSESSWAQSQLGQMKTGFCVRENTYCALIDANYMLSVRHVLKNHCI